MIDVVQALELLEICAEEIATEDEECEPDAVGNPRQRVSLTARALATRQLTVADLVNWPLGILSHNGVTSYEPAMTLGALIVFRTADRFWRAGASTDRALIAVYCAAQRYAEMIPHSLHDDVDKAAIDELMADTQSLTAARRVTRLTAHE
jgi:hypothetical protein